MANEVAKKDDYALTISNAVNALGQMSEDLDGLSIKFPRIKIPAGGGIAFEVEGDDPENPDLTKEIKAVILHHHPVHAYYKEKYTGGSQPPDCGSVDGRSGVVYETGEVKSCATCPLNRFGSGENGAKACKQKRRLYILKDGDTLPTILSVPTGSLAEYGKYIMRLLSKGQKANAVVTKFTLKKAQNKGGITYSQIVLAADRRLDESELAAVATMTEQVKAFAKSAPIETEEDTDIYNPFTE